VRAEKVEVVAQTRREPVRTCVACRGEAAKSGLVRIVRRTEGGAVVDRTGHASGRGAYLHADVTCIETARKRKALERALKTGIAPDIWDDLLRTNT
jgi:uncharacterized protein